MGKSILILVGLITVTISAGRLSLSDSQQAEAEDRGAHQFEILARQAAHTGYAEATQVLTSGADPATLTVRRGTTNGGTYEAQFTVDAATPRDVRVRIEGRAGAERHIVEALFRARSTDGPPGESLERVPPYLRYAVFSGGPLRLAALPRVQTHVDSVNASVHTNGNLNILLSLSALTGATAIEGFGSYAGDLMAAPFTDPSRAFRPVLNEEGAPTLRAVDPVSVPRIDVAAMASRATQTAHGTLRVLGRTSLGTRDDPEIIHVQGDLVLLDTQFEGYGTYLVEGNVVVEATLSGLAGVLAGRPESHVAVYASGPIVFNGTGDVEGQFLSDQSVTFSGAATLYGSVAARESVNFVVAPTVRFVPPSPELTIDLPDNPRPREMVLVTMREWEVVDAAR